MRFKNVLKALVDPRYLCEKLAGVSARRRRMARLRGTIAEGLEIGYVDSLELLEMARPLGIKSICDIGANVGTWSLLAKAVIPNASIEAFEPLAAHRPDFEKRLMGIAGVTLHDVALGPENTTAKLHVTENSDSTSMLEPSEKGLEDFGIAEVSQVTATVRRLDDYLREKHLPHPDLIKLDVQGYELEVLRGAAASLAGAKAIIAEVSFSRYYKGQCLFHELVAFLAQHGFSVAAFAVCTPTGSLVNMTDVLFLKREGVKI